MSMNYRVHVYRVVRQAVEVEAGDHQEAIALAQDAYFSPGLAGVEDAEEIVGFLVDEEGDEDYEFTRYYDADGNPDNMMQREAEQTFAAHQPPLPI